MAKKDIIPHPLTFHIQIRQDAAVQQQAADLQLFFARPDVVAALRGAQPQLVHFARILQIPNNQPTQPDGTFAVQVVIVYDGEDMTPLLTFFWNTPPLRSLFQQLYDMSVPVDANPRKDGTPGDFDGFCKYILYNNLTPLPSELHRGYNMTVDDIISGFPPPPPLTSFS